MRGHFLLDIGIPLKHAVKPGNNMFLNHVLYTSPIDIKIIADTSICRDTFDITS